MKAYIRRKTVPGEWMTEQWVQLLIEDAISITFTIQEPDRNDRSNSLIELPDGMKIEPSAAAGSRGLIITEA